MINYIMIPHQKAVAILKREDPEYWGKTYRQMKERTRFEFLLKTGAKLVWSGYFNTWAIHGYHYNGEDVNPYRKGE